MPSKHRGNGTGSSGGGMRPGGRSRDMAAPGTGSTAEMNLENRSKVMIRSTRRRRGPPSVGDTTTESLKIAETPCGDSLTVADSRGLSLQRNRVIVGFNSETPQENYRKEKTGPSRPQSHPPVVLGAGTIPGMLSEREMKHSEGNAAFLRDSTLCNRKEITSGAHCCTDPSLDAGHGNATALESKEPTSDNEHLAEEITHNIEEANYAIQQLNELDLGEEISYEEFNGYLAQLPCNPPPVDTSVEPDHGLLDELQVRNIVYRIKYCKLTHQRRKSNETLGANRDDDHPLYHLEEEIECLEEDVTKLEGDYLLEYLDNKGLLGHIENDDIFGWSFHYCTVADCDDYQRIVPQNYGGYEYENWDTYSRYFHSYEVELEYLFYWEELLKKLKWMEDYMVIIKRPSLKWGKICTRGCYEAIKIATHYSKITEGLARAAFYECINTMFLYIYRCKEWDDIYLEIWQRVTMLKESFKVALNQVYKLEKFPWRHQKMKDAVENDNWSEMEREFHICTAGISEKITEDKARELIADAIKNQRVGPKFYAQYIAKKMDIASAIGVITKRQNIRSLQN
ncbi:hypothetical protein EJB05_33437 [Eragrostis curvula]|uniref:Uncharacterized protein n=1 Tax=Eragrostis curvula TaxID=38414 RepID=A0A5J9U133_9POAL|nr:hypothetical protein EJB05_33437 [Eragrostis curvula]